MINEKFNKLHNLYRQTCKDKNIKLDLLNNQEIFCYINQDGVPIIKILNYELDERQKPEFIIFLDKDISLAKHLEMMRFNVFNSAKSIEICDNKIETYQSLANKGVPMIKSLISPLYFMYDANIKEQYEALEQYLLNINNEFTYPLVLKEAYGSFGEQVYLVNNFKELMNLKQKLILKPHIIQQFIKSSEGRDVRLQVVGKEVVASVLRTNKNDFRANVTNGGSMEIYTENESFKELALKVVDILNLDFAGVDILFDKKNRPVLCEVNSNAHIVNISEITGVNIADSIIEHIINKLS